MSLTKKDVARFIDHTILRPDATEKDIIKVINEAKTFGFAGCCVNQCWLPLAVNLLKGTSVKVCSVVGFPLGANASAVKALEAKKCVEEGAEEIDMVMNIGFLRSGKYDIVEKDIKKVVENTKPNIIVKVILETGFLTDEEKRIACNIAESAGAHFVKTSTGLWNFGATVEDVRLMKEVVKNRMEVKAAGGIRTYEQAIKMIEAGASRIGTSTGVDIVL